MNRSYLHKALLFLIITIFNPMQGMMFPIPGRFRAVSIDYDGTRLAWFKKEKASEIDDWKTKKTLGELLNKLKDASNKRTYNEKQFLLLEIAYDLIQKDPSIVNTPDAAGNTPLFTAAQLDLDAFVALFLFHGATMPANENDEHHPLKVSRRDSNVQQIIKAYIAAPDKEAFKQKLKKNFRIPGATFFGVDEPAPEPITVATLKPISIAYDADKLKEVKPLDHWKTEKNVANLVHELGGGDNEQRCLLFKKIHDLLKEDPRRVNELDGGQESALYNAVRFNSEALAALFIAYGATMPEDENDKHHPLNADNYGNAYHLVVGYTLAPDREAFSSQVAQKLEIPNITLQVPDSTPVTPVKQTSSTSQSQPIPQSQTVKNNASNPGSLKQTPATSQGQSTQPSQAPDNNTRTTALIVAAAACGIVGLSYALYNKMHTPKGGSYQDEILVNK
jgi:ankyrin repeat protein